MPPTQDVLLQHCKHSLYQTGIWATSIEVQQMLPFPVEYFGTKISNSWAPVWITIPEVPKAYVNYHHAKEIVQTVHVQKPILFTTLQILKNTL